MDRDELIESLARTAATHCDGLLHSNMVYAVDALAGQLRDAPNDGNARVVEIKLTVRVTKRETPGYDVEADIAGRRVSKWHDATDPEAVGTDQPELPGVEQEG